MQGLVSPALHKDVCRQSVDRSGSQNGQLEIVLTALTLSCAHTTLLPIPNVLEPLKAESKAKPASSDHVIVC